MRTAFDQAEVREDSAGDYAADLALKGVDLSCPRGAASAAVTMTDEPSAGLLRLELTPVRARVELTAV